MLLNLIEARLGERRGTTENSDSGFALITVIGIMAVTAIIAIAITSSAISAVSFTTSTRATVQARAVADAGVDTAWVALSGGTFLCASSGSTPTGSYSTTIAYFGATGAALACSGATVSGVPSKAVVNSTGVPSSPGVAGGSAGNQRTITALFDIVVHPSTVTLDRAVFSDGDLNLTNNLNLMVNPAVPVPASLYSNGNVSCAANNPLVQGSVFAQGNFGGPNQCDISGTVWVGGSASLTSQVKIRGDLYSVGGSGTPATPVSLDTGFVGGSLVANGSVTIAGTTNVQPCPLSGYDAKVCGSVVSVESSIALSGMAKVAGGLYARGTVNLGNTNDTLMAGGNVVSTTGSLLGTAVTGAGFRVGGYVAVSGSSDVPVARIGNAASSCSTSFIHPCVPAQPAIPMSAIPAPLNFPTNTRVVAPPRESLPRIDMYPDAGLAAKWSGWNIQHVACADVQTTIAAGWLGKKLLIADSCTAPISWNGTEVKLTGDLAIMSQAGFVTSNNAKVKSSVAGTSHTLMLIVPSDSKKTAGTDLATWNTPIPSVPTYTRPSCAADPADVYGDIRTDNLTITDTKSFFYTPCDIVMSNAMTGFNGQMYSGTTSMPNNSTFYMAEITVPGVTAPAGAGASVTATQTARFDARDTP